MTSVGLVDDENVAQAPQRRLLGEENEPDEYMWGPHDFYHLPYPSSTNDRRLFGEDDSSDLHAEYLRTIHDKKKKQLRPATTKFSSKFNDYYSNNKNHYMINSADMASVTDDSNAGINLIIIGICAGALLFLYKKGKFSMQRQHSSEEEVNEMDYQERFDNLYENLIL